MEDGETNEGDTKGKETTDNSKDDKAPVSLYDKTEAVVTRQEEANKKREELLEREEKLYANQRLAGTAGGKVEPEKPKVDTNEEYADKLKKGEVNPLKEDGIEI